MNPIDWTQVLVQTVPPVFSAIAGAFVTWLHLRKDARLGRSLRPPKRKMRPHVNDLENPRAAQLDDPRPREVDEDEDTPARGRRRDRL